jgi:hypothetical protein
MMRTAIRRALVAGLVVGVALLAALSGCAGGSVCFRNSDCPSGYGCRHGACELLSVPSSDAGDASPSDNTSSDASSGNVSSDDASTDDAGDDASQSADAG